MAINFPASPNLNDTFVSGGVTYTWDGTVWVASGPAAFVQKSGDTMTGDLTVPNLVASSNVQAASLNSGPLAGFRNQLMNPNFTVQQRGISFSAPSDEYTADRWWMGNAAGRNVDFTNDGPYQNALRITNNTADNVFLRQGIEIQQGKCGPFTLGSVWTLSLWSDSNGWIGRPLGASAFRDAGKMNDSFGQASVTATSFVATGETVGLFSRYALQVTIDASPAATHEMLCIGLTLPAGGHRISAVQLEPGPVATPFEHRFGELALCQRYYQTISQMDVTPAQANGVTYSGQVVLPVIMRATPSATVGTWNNLPSPSDAVPTTYSFKVYGNAPNQTISAAVLNVTLDAEL